MTGFDKSVTRRTVGHYRIGLTGAYPSPTGKRIVAELKGDAHGDLLRMRIEGHKTWVELSVPDLFAKGLIAQARKKL
jgi:hypothetical protein